MNGQSAAAVVVGTSAGGLEALTAILPELPPGFPLPIMVVIHLPANRVSIIAELLSAKCALDVREAEDKEPIQKGTIYFAPPDYHLLVEMDQCLSLSSDEPVNFSRPAIDVLFESAADAYRTGLVGIILTGANEDGALGLRRIYDCGGVSIVQAPTNAQSSIMPLAAIKACPESLVMTLPEIAAYLLEVANL